LPAVGPAVRPASARKEKPGVLLLSSINKAIRLMRLPREYTQVIHGLSVLAAMLVDTIRQFVRRRMA